MKRKAGILARLVVLGVVVYLGGRLCAQQPVAPPAQPTPTRIGMVNMVEVVKNYKKAQNLEAELRRLQQEWENKLKPFRDQANALKNLKVLELSQTQVTDAGAKELAALQNLTTLDLGHTKVTDEGVKALATLRNLTALDLCGTKVTDVGLKELVGLEGFTTLGLSRTAVTDAACVSPRRNRPQRLGLFFCRGRAGFDVSLGLSGHWAGATAAGIKVTGRNRVSS